MMDTAAYQRKIDELQQQLEASQRVNARVNQDLDRKYRQALEDNAQLRQSLNGMPMHQQPHHHHMPHHMSHHHHGQHQHHAPSHQMHYMSHHGSGYGGGVPGQMPVQPQQPVNVTVGPRGHSVGLQPPPPPPPPPMPASVDNRAADEIAHLKAELALKQQIIDQYRIKTKAMNLGLENIQSPSSSLERLPTTPLGPAQGPAAKTAPARPGRQSGGGRTLLDVLAQQDASPVESAAATTTCSPRGADIGIQNSVATHDAFCQTEPQASFGSATSASSSSTAKGNKGAAAPPPTPSDPSVPLTTSFVDAASGGVAEAFFTSTAVLDTVGRLPTSKPLRVNLFVAQAGVSSVSNGSFNCLPAALVAEVLTPSLPNGSAAPNSKFGSWADEPTELFGGSTNSLPAARVSVPNQGSPSNGPKRQAPPNSSAPSNHTSAMNGSGSLSRGGSFENGRNSLGHGKKTSSNGKITATSSSM